MNRFLFVSPPLAGSTRPTRADAGAPSAAPARSTVGLAAAPLRELASLTTVWAP